jgi:FkbM family methyltransferase
MTLHRSITLFFLCVLCALCADPGDPDFDEKNYKVYFVSGIDACFYIDDVPDGIKAHLRRGDYWESAIGTLIKTHSVEGTTVVDIGAHIGIHTITMSRKVGPEGKVISFEPQHKIFAEQLENLRINDCSNVTPLCKAAGETFKTIELSSRNPENEGGTSLGSGGDFAEMITLDSLKLNHVSLIKVDVERYEYFVFLGAQETILRNRPVLIFEVMGEHDYTSCSEEIKARFDQVFSFVASLGYKISLIFGNDYIAFPTEDPR